MENTPKKFPDPIRTPPKPQSVNTASFTKDAASINLPDIDHASALLTNQATKPDEIIEGILHAGTKAVLASASKVGKTWILLYMAAAIASGKNFWKFKTRKRKVLFINFEIRREFIADRLKVIQSQLEGEDLSQLHVWNLRGITADFEVLVKTIIERARKEGYALIIIDPIYKAMVGKSENTASSVGAMCNQIEQIVEATGAAVIFAHHYAKGSAAKKNQIDRMSGSGVFARDADSIITLTQHAEKDCYSVEMTLRNLAPQSAFVAEWKYPVMVERPDLSASDFESDEPDADEYEPLVSLLDESPLTTGEWLEAAVEIGYSRASFFRDKDYLVKQNRVQTNTEKTWTRNQSETCETLIPEQVRINNKSQVSN